jgi:hypothetical protein
MSSSLYVFESVGGGHMLQPMSGFLTESRLALLRRAAAAGHVSAATAEEKAALDELVEKDLTRDGRLIEAGWSKLRETDHDLGSD